MRDKLPDVEVSLPAWMVIAKRQLGSLRSEKTILFAILIQLIVAMFSSFLVVGMVSMYDPSGVEQGQIIEFGVSGDKADEIEPYLLTENGVNVEVYESRGEAIEAFENGELHGVIHSTENSDGRVSTTVIAPDEGIQSTLTVVRAQSVLEEYESDKRTQLAAYEGIQTLDLAEQSDTPPYVSFTYTVLIPLLLFLPAFISGAIVIDSVIQDRRTGILELVKSAPITETDIIQGKLAVPLALGPLQMAIWLVLLRFNGITLNQPLLILAIGTGLTLGAIAIGATVTQYTNNRGAAQFLYSTALVFALGVTTLLPELPITTIARLGIGSYSAETALLGAGYLLVGAIAFHLTLRSFTLDYSN